MGSFWNLIVARRLFLAGLLAIGWSSTVRAIDEPVMRIAFPSGMNGQIVVTMEKAKLTERAGLKATFSSFQYGPPMMEALAGGSIDAVVTSLMPVTAYAAKIPGDAQIVAMVGNSSHSLMVGKDSDVKGAKQLQEKKVGVSFGSDSHLDTLVWLKSNGLNGKVSLVNVAPAELVTALTNGSVDAVVIRQPQVLRLQQQVGARIIHTWPFRFVSIVKAKFIQDHPKAVEKYLSTLRSAILYIAQNKEQASVWFGEYLRMDPEIVRQVSNDDPFYNIQSIDQIDISVGPAARKLVEEWVSNAFAEKLIKQQVDVKQLVR